MPEPRVRIAPSHTGPLHIRTARTALFNYLYTRRHGDRFILRLEDTDVARSTVGFEADILDQLHWLGIAWDEGPDVVGGDDRGRGRASGPRGRWQAGRAAFPRSCRQDQVRRPGSRRGRDRHRQPRRDFVIVRSYGTPLYHFTVVGDDAAMDISHVIRGEDHLSNTPKHILLFQALGHPVMAFAHLCRSARGRSGGGGARPRRPGRQRLRARHHAVDRLPGRLRRADAAYGR